MMRLYTMSRNSAGWRVRIALALKRLDYLTGDEPAWVEA